MAFTRSTVSTTNISDLPNQPLISATALKAKFDKYGADDKPYINDTLLPELESTTNGNSGADNVGSATITGVTGNTVWAQLANIASQLLNNYLSKTNSVAYTPTQPYHPATKKYSDDGIAGAVIGQLPLGSVTEPYIADDAVTQLKIADGAVDYAKLSSGIKGRFAMTDKAIAELLMIADIDSKVFSPNLNKFYTNFSTAMDYSMGNVDSTYQTYVGSLSAGASSVTVTSSTGFFAKQEISIQDSTNYEDVVLISVVGNTLNFKTPLVNSYTNPAIYRSNNNGQNFGNAGGNIIPVGSVFGLHFNNDFTDFVGSAVNESNTGTFDTTNKKFGSASILYSGSQFTQYADSEIFNFGNGEWYAEAWIRNGSIGSLANILGQSGASTTVSNAPFGLQRDASDRYIFTVSNGSAFTTVLTSPYSNTSDFVHVRFGRAGNNIYISLNGTVSSPVAFSGTLPNSTNKFCIGRWGENSVVGFNGWIDEFVIVKNQPMNTTNFTPPSAEYGGTQTTKNVIRMNIAPYEDVKYISAWLTKTEFTGFTVDGKASIVDSAADESYVDLTETTTDIGSTNEVMMVGSVPTADSKVTLKLILNRASTSDSVSFTKLVGGVSA